MVTSQLDEIDVRARLPPSTDRLLLCCPCFTGSLRTPTAPLASLKLTRAALLRLQYARAWKMDLSDYPVHNDPENIFAAYFDVITDAGQHLLSSILQTEF